MMSDKINYLKVFESFPGMALLIDPEDYSIVDVNKGYLKKQKISKTYLLNKKCFQIMHKEIRPCRKSSQNCPLKMVLSKKKSVTVEHIHYDSHNNPYHSQVSVSLVEDPSSNKQLLLYVSFPSLLEKKFSSSISEIGKGYLKKLKFLTLKDQLTGVYNYQYLMEKLPTEVYHAKRYNDSFSLAMIDIDYFKSINNTYGYRIGDLLLSEFSNFLKIHLRQSDILVRYSGEEFMIVLPHTDKIDTLMLANRLIAKINAHQFKIHNIKLKIKVSIGTFTFSEINIFDMPEDLINAADKALQRAKESGGNTAIAFSDLYKESTAVKKKINTYEEISMLKRKVKKLSESVDRVVLESIYAFAKSMEARDFYTAVHAEDMVSLVLRLGKELGLNKEMLQNLEKGAMLHDIGKIGISDSILRKKSKLSKQEYGIIKTHPKIGAEIIRAIRFLKDVVPIVLHHHERWDGKGYPSGLKEREIPLLARIVSIADAYQALTSDRSYRKAYTRKKALEILKQETGKNFDKDLVDTLIRIETKRSRRHAKKQ